MTLRIKIITKAIINKFCDRVIKIAKIDRNVP